MQHKADAWSSSTIAVMCSCQSLCLVATTHHRLSLFVSFVGSVSGHGLLPCPSITKLSPGVPPSCGHRTLRQHASLLHNATLHKVHGQSVAKLLWWSCTAVAPYRVYAAGVMQSCLRWQRSPVVGAPRSLRALRAATCRPLGVPAWWLWSGALRSAFSQRLRRVIGVGPRPPLALARLLRKHRLRGLPVRPPRGLPQNRAKVNTTFSTRCVEPCVTSKTMQKVHALPQMGDTSDRLSVVRLKEIKV